MTADTVRPGDIVRAGGRLYTAKYVVDGVLMGTTYAGQKPEIVPLDHLVVFSRTHQTRPG